MTEGRPAGAEMAEGVLGIPAARAALAAAARQLGCDEAGVDLGEPQKLSGGASRLTYVLEPTAKLGRSNAGSPAAPSATRLILQMERPGSAGSNLEMSAQADLLRAAREVGVPVPEVLGSGGEKGSAFVVLEWLAGEAVVRKVMRDDSLATARADLARQAGAALAAVHRIDADGHSALDEGDPLEQMRALLDMLAEPHPAFEIGLCWLEANRPDPRPPVVTHGDFRMGNLLISNEGITAVLDWELAHLGSAAEDLGWFCCRAWRFGSPLRAGGVGSVEDLLGGYAQAGGTPPSSAELDWWEAYGTLRWGLICVLQASVHLKGLHRSVELAAIGRRSAECEEDLLSIVAGESDYLPPVADDVGGGSPVGVARGIVHDRPSAAELLEAVGESLVGLRDSVEGSASFEARVSANVVALLRREVLLSEEIGGRHIARMDGLGVDGQAELAAMIRAKQWRQLDGDLISAVRADVRDKLAVSNPGYWVGDR